MFKKGGTPNPETIYILYHMYVYNIYYTLIYKHCRASWLLNYTYVYY
jgi:hypothetical protein